MKPTEEKAKKCDPSHADDAAEDTWESFPLDKFAPDIAKVLMNEKESLRQTEEVLVDLEEKHRMEEIFVNFFSSGETKDVVDLDVSGEKMTTKRSTLMRLKDSALARQFDDKVWATERQHDEAAESDSDDDGVMIEQSSYCFGKIVDHLRLCSIVIEGYSQPPPPTVVSHQRENFARLVAYYFPGMEDSFICPVDTAIMSLEQVYQVSSWLPEGKELKGLLLYRASRDGWASQNFHRSCDNKGPTVTVVKSTAGFIFGGYTETPWSSADAVYKGSPGASLFSLRCFDGLGPVKMPLNQPDHPNEVFHHAPHCATFGGGHDLVILSNPTPVGYESVGSTGPSRFILIGQLGVASSGRGFEAKEWGL